MTSRLEDGQLALAGMTPALCHWCGRPLPPGGPPNQRACSQKCRQAKHRFRVAPAGVTAAKPMRFGYADPPYPGLALKYYGDRGGAEVDHAELVARLEREHPDGWALSTSADALQFVLALCPAGARVCPWVRGARRSKRRGSVARRVPNAWEPLIVVRGRPITDAVAQDLTDVLVWGGRQHTHPGALVGMKPAAFAEWMFRQLGAAAGDELVDLFPGSGAIGRAWRLYARLVGRKGLPSRLAGEAAPRVLLDEDDAAAGEGDADGHPDDDPPDAVDAGPDEQRDLEREVIAQRHGVDPTP